MRGQKSESERKHNRYLSLGDFEECCWTLEGQMKSVYPKHNFSLFRICPSWRGYLPPWIKFSIVSIMESVEHQPLPMNQPTCSILCRYVGRRCWQISVLFPKCFSLPLDDVCSLFVMFPLAILWLCLNPHKHQCLWLLYPALSISVLAASTALLFVTYPMSSLKVIFCSLRKMSHPSFPQVLGLSLDAPLIWVHVIYWQGFSLLILLNLLYFSIAEVYRVLGQLLLFQNAHGHLFICF